MQETQSCLKQRNASTKKTEETRRVRKDTKLIQIPPKKRVPIPLFYSSQMSDMKMSIVCTGGDRWVAGWGEARLKGQHKTETVTCVSEQSLYRSALKEWAEDRPYRGGQGSVTSHSFHQSVRALHDRTALQRG